MRIQIIVHAALLSLGLGLSAWASPRIVPSAPVPEIETPAGNEPRNQPVMPPVVPRGQMLYENQCMSCHESVVHIRARQQVKSLPQLRASVQNWVDYLQLRWGREEIEDVVTYLNSQYYRFDRP